MKIEQIEIEAREEDMRYIVMSIQNITRFPSNLAKLIISEARRIVFVLPKNVK